MPAILQRRVKPTEGAPAHIQKIAERIDKAHERCEGWEHLRKLLIELVLSLHAEGLPGASDWVLEILDDEDWEAFR